MKQPPARAIAAVLCLLACSAVLVPCVTARDPCEDWDYPVIGFRYTVIESETLPVTVQFNGTYTTRADEPVERWRWDYDDGTTSAERITRHAYTTYQDHYRVCAEGTTICGKSDQDCQDVNAYCTAPKAGFTIDVSEGPAPLAVRVMDTSEHTPGSVTTWVYKKDGSTIATERDFSGTFTQPGTYTITQTVKKNCNPAGDSFSRTIHVTPAVVQGYILNISIPTTTPAIGIVGVYFIFNNTTSAVTTTTTAAGAGMTTAATTTAMPGIITGTTTRVPVSAAATGGVPGVPPPGTGTLTVTTDPAGATVYVDNVMRGSSPVTVPGLAAGPHTLRLEKTGYSTMAVPFTIEDGKTTEYSTALVPESGGKTPLGALTAVIACAGAGAYLLLKKKKAP